MIKISHLSKKFGNLEDGCGECYDGTGSYQTYEQRRSA